MNGFHCPTKVYSGHGALQALAQYQCKKVLLITDPFFSQDGKALEIGRNVPGAQVKIFDRVVPDPPISLAAEGAAVCQQFGPELLIALGGGSALDCAKAIYLASGLDIPFIAIPTTSGSGSEMTSFSILTRDDVKLPLVDPKLRPTAAILDGDLLERLPSGLIANAGMDVLAHCMEALAAKGHTGFTDALAFHAAQTLLMKLERSFEGDCGVRMELHEAASMAGLAFDQAGLGVCHALAHAIGGAFHLPHGQVCAILLPAVMCYNAPEAIEQYAKLAKQCGLPAATERLALRNLISSIERLRRRLKLPDTLAAAGVSKAQWETKKNDLLREALKDPCCKTNPVPVDLTGLEGICKAVAP